MLETIWINFSGHCTALQHVFNVQKMMPSFYHFAKCQQQIIIAQTPNISKFTKQICTEPRRQSPQSRPPRPARGRPRYPWRSRMWSLRFSAPPPPRLQSSRTQIFSPIPSLLSPSKLLPDWIDLCLDPILSHICHLAEHSSGQRALRL